MGLEVGQLNTLSPSLPLWSELMASERLSLFSLLAENRERAKYNKALLLCENCYCESILIRSFTLRYIHDALDSCIFKYKPKKFIFHLYLVTVYSGFPV